MLEFHQASKIQMRIKFTGLFLGYRLTGGCVVFSSIKTLIINITPLKFKGCFSLTFGRLL